MIHKIVQTIQETVEIGHPSLCTWLNQTVSEDEQFHDTVELEGTQVKVQLDSSAKAHVISLKSYSSLKCRPLPPLRKTRTVLVSFSEAQAETL